MNIVSLSFLLSAVLLNAIAQLCLKASTNAIGNFTFSVHNLVPIGLKFAINPYFLGGVGCYALSLVIWVMGLSRVEVSVAYPLLSVGYILNILGAWALLGEHITPMRLLGTAVIIVGVVLVTRS